MEEMARQYKKKRIPRALREAVWIHHCGRTFEQGCRTPWCKNTINVFDFQTGHNIPESKGGATAIDNLVPLCSRCNLSMGNQYTFQEWSTRFSVSVKKPLPWWKRFFGCFPPKIRPASMPPPLPLPPSSISTNPSIVHHDTPQSASDSTSTSS